ncbi:MULTISPECIES: zinc-ribbon domain-containing protein [unclassified Arthrobacter]|uniref:zinc-ribbon domain-containing protein n=1 Tax=unclassified Arthrobacter TaxID=235627 RepID=UPI001F1CE4CA|nr:zinc-ribbon domain-containing protein [Arthrobacter sp. FW305-BF8]UKA56061.1 zinc ribbon domain-containing protein [Arthrobacter sp. FW305-BF8]
MLLLFGFKTVQKLLPGRTASCRYCGVFAHQHLEERATKFTLFFIPVFTTSRSYRVTCSNCGATSVVNSRQKQALVG